ncbi:alpha/beta-hydrolase [Sarocladium strictum]
MSGDLQSSFLITPAGHKLHYLSTANKEATPLICLHGLGGSTNTFLPLRSQIPENFRFIAVDFPGFGQSQFSKSAPPISVSSYVADLHHLVTSLQADPSQPAKKIVLFGHSLGAVIALHYAACHPETVVGLGLLGAGRAAGHIPAAKERMLGLAAGVREKGIQFAADLAAKTNFYEGSEDRSEDPTLKEKVRAEVAASDPEAYAQAAEAMVAADHSDPDYSQIKCPAAFVAGNKDMISPVERSKGLSELVGGDSWVEVVKSGHQPILEDPITTMAALSKLLKKVQT